MAHRRLRWLGGTPPGYLNVFFPILPPASLGSPATPLSFGTKDALIEMTKKNMGCVIVSNKNNKGVGFFTDGDLRRSIKKLLDIHDTSIIQIMTKKFLSCNEDDYASDTLDIMKNNKINSLPVLDKKNKIIGAINMHILIDSGIN